MPSPRFEVSMPRGCCNVRYNPEVAGLISNRAPEGTTFLETETQTLDALLRGMDSPRGCIESSLRKDREHSNPRPLENKCPHPIVPRVTM